MTAEFVPTHVIEEDGKLTEVRVVDGVAYTKLEWDTETSADWEISKTGVLTFQGSIHHNATIRTVQPPNVTVTKVTKRNVAKLRETWPPLDQRAELEVGNLLWKFPSPRGETFYGIAFLDVGRAMFCAGGQSLCGDARIDGEDLGTLEITTDDGCTIDAWGNELL